MLKNSFIFALLFLTSQATLAATNIYRSVGYNVTTALATGAGNAVTITATTATFAVALGNTIGVGDAIQYDSDGNSTIDAIAFITGKTAGVNTSYTIQKADGTNVTATVVGDTDWSIFRAYSSLHNMQGLSENSGIAAGVVNFDTSRDLTSPTERILNVALYGTTADRSFSDNFSEIENWTMNANTYMRIYAPYLTTEVGVTQRHSGTYDATKATISIAQDYSKGIFIGTNTGGRFRIEGLQFKTTANGILRQGLHIYDSSNAELWVSHCIFDMLSDESSGIFIATSVSNNMNSYIFNNLIYNHNYKGIGADQCAGGTGFTYIYNNTIDGKGLAGNPSGRGISSECEATKNILKNNISVNNMGNGGNREDYYDGNSAANARTTFGTSTHNVSSDSTAPTGVTNTPSVTPVFVNSAAGDYRLSSSDTTSYDLGTDLSADANLPFSVDIKLTSRGTTWDRGAFDHQTSITMSNFVTSLITSTGFTATFDFSGDENSDASCTLYYCNQTDSAGCNPTTGSSAAMARGASSFSVAVSGLVNPNNPNDVLNIRATCTDADGTNGPLNTTVTLANDTLAPKAPTGVSAL